MEYRTFGRTGWQVSEIAFGGWQIGGEWGDVDDEASIATLLHSLRARHQLRRHRRLLRQWS